MQHARDRVKLQAKVRSESLKALKTKTAAFGRGIEFYFDFLADDGKDMLSRNVGNQFGQGY